MIKEKIILLHLTGSAETVKMKKTQINNKAFSCMIQKFSNGTSVRAIYLKSSLLPFLPQVFMYKEIFRLCFFATFFACTNLEIK